MSEENLSFAERWKRDVFNPNKYDWTGAGFTSLEKTIQHLTMVQAYLAAGINLSQPDLEAAIRVLRIQQEIITKVNLELPLSNPPVTPEDARFLEVAKKTEAGLKEALKRLTAAPTPETWQASAIKAAQWGGFWWRRGRFTMRPQQGQPMTAPAWRGTTPSTAGSATTPSREAWGRTRTGSRAATASTRFRTTTPPVALPTASSSAPASFSRT